ncbi:MAG: hypothetical protein JWQ02_1635 [Capsulimonas sp.]|nr:hypothetical protein [Capsulimonas sp.]
MPKKTPHYVDPLASSFTNPLLAPANPLNLIISRGPSPAPPKPDLLPYVKPYPGMGNLTGNGSPMPSPARQVKTAAAYQQARRGVVGWQAAQGGSPIDPKSELFLDAQKYGGIAKRIPMPYFGGERVIFNTSGANRIGYYGVGRLNGRRIQPPSFVEAPAEGAPDDGVLQMIKDAATDAPETMQRQAQSLGNGMAGIYRKYQAPVTRAVALGASYPTRFAYRKLVGDDGLDNFVNAAIAKYNQFGENVNKDTALLASAPGQLGYALGNVVVQGTDAAIHGGAHLLAAAQRNKALAKQHSKAAMGDLAQIKQTGKSFADGVSGGDDGAFSKSVQALYYLHYDKPELAKSTALDVVNGIGKEAFEHPLQFAATVTMVGDGALGAAEKLAAGYEYRAALYSRAMDKAIAAGDREAANAAFQKYSQFRQAGHNIRLKTEPARAALNPATYFERKAITATDATKYGPGVPVRVAPIVAGVKGSAPAAAPRSRAPRLNVIDAAPITPRLGAGSGPASTPSVIFVKPGQASIRTESGDLLPLTGSQAITNASEFSQSLQKHFGHTKMVADYSAAIAEERARAWSRATGRPKEGWYRSRLGGLQSGGAPPANALYQYADGIAPRQNVRGKVGLNPNVIDPEDLRHEDGTRKIGFPIYGDRMRVGRYEPLDPSSGIEIQMSGGPGYGMHPEHYGISGWASEGGSIANALANKIRDTDGVGYIVIGAKDSVMSNKEYWEIYNLETEHALKTGKLSRKNLSLGIQAAAKKAKIPLPSKKGFYHLRDIDPSALTFDQRRKFLFRLGGGGLAKTTKGAVAKYGTVANKDIVPRTTNFPDHDTGGFVGAVQFDKSNPNAILAEELGVPKHPAYQYVHRGHHLGYFSEPIPWYNALSHYVRERGDVKPTWNTYRSAYGKRPSFLLDEDLLQYHTSGNGENIGNLDQRRIAGTEGRPLSALRRTVEPGGTPGTRRGDGGGGGGRRSHHGRGRASEELARGGVRAPNDELSSSSGAGGSGGAPQESIRRGVRSSSQIPSPGQTIDPIQVSNTEASTHVEASSAVDPNSPKTLYQGAKGAVHFLDDGRAVIHAFQGADTSTVVHELGHIFRRDLEGVHLQNVEAWAGVKNGVWEVEHEEKFARAFERYLREGKAPTRELVPVFRQFKDWLRGVYRTVKNGPLAGNKITPELRDAFDHLLGGGNSPGGVSSKSFRNKAPANAGASFMSQADVNAARGRIQERRLSEKKMASTFDLSDNRMFDDAVVIGAHKIAAHGGAIRYSQWQNQMVSEAGDWVKPRLGALWATSRAASGAQSSRAR